MEARGDLETGAHHTVEDVGICIGQALDEALGDRAGIARYGQATIPMDEARASCAIDVSGRGLCAFEATLPPGAIGNFDHELVEEFFRALALNAKLTLHLTIERGTNAHHMIEAAFKAAARALRRGHGAGRGRARCAEHEGHAHVTSVAVIDYGMGNRRSVEKALEHVGARTAVTGDHDELRAADGLVLPGVGAFPQAMRNLEELGLQERDRRMRRTGHPAPRDLPRHAAAVLLLGGDGRRRPGSV